MPFNGSNVVFITRPWASDIVRAFMSVTTKMAHFIPLKTEVTVAELAQPFLRVVWKLHGLPDEIIMDRDTKITSLFWQKLMDLMGIISKMTTAFHPQSDGQTEGINQILEEYCNAGVMAGVI